MSNRTVRERTRGVQGTPWHTAVTRLPSRSRAGGPAQPFGRGEPIPPAMLLHPADRTVAPGHTAVPDGRHGTHAPRPGRACLLVAAAAACCLSPLWLAADEPAAVNRRFEVHRQAEGFVLLGFRASIGQADRFVLRPGMPADQARLQMQSVGWRSSAGLRDPESLEMEANRVRFRDVSETIAVVLDPTGQFVQTVAYQWQPALFSHEGLLRYLRAAFDSGEMLINQPDRILVRYGPVAGQVLRVEATRVSGPFISWRIVFRMDAAVTTPSSSGEAPPGEPSGQ